MTPEERALLATRIAAKRRELGMTQEQAAQAIGVHRVTLARWEAGGEVSAEHWPAILEVLGIEVVESVSISVDGVA